LVLFDAVIISSDVKNMDKIAKFSAKYAKNAGLRFKAGDIVKVHQKIKEDNKERIQIFEGLVIAKKHGKGVNATFTVRRVVSGVGVEKTYPLHSPLVSKVDVVKGMKTRRAKLYYLRTAKGKKSKFRDVPIELRATEEDVLQEDEQIEDEQAEQEKQEEIKQEEKDEKDQAAEKATQTTGEQEQTAKE